MKNCYSCRIWVEGIEDPVDVSVKANSVKELQLELKDARFICDQSEENSIDFYPLNKVYKLKLLLDNEEG